MPVSYFQEGGVDGMSSKFPYVCMIYAQIPNILLQNILSSRCIGCCSIFRETSSFIGIQHRIWASMSTPFGFRVDTRISFGLHSNMLVMVSKLMMFVIVATRTLSFIARITYLNQNIIFLWLLRYSFGF